MLEIRNVYKSYDKTEVLHDISFEVQENSIHALIGENNAGKTTLLKILAGIYRADKGSILYDGELVFDNPAVKQKVAYVADQGAFLRGYSVRRIIKLYQTMYPSFSLDLFEQMNRNLSVDTGSIVQTLSKGTTAKLAFMLALSCGGDYLLLDEPFSGVDAESRRYMMDTLIRETEKRELSVLISSHDLGELEKVCDTITVLKAGRVLKTADTDQVLNTFVKVTAAFEGEAPKDMEDLKGVIEISHVGNIYTVISDMDSEKTEKVLKKYGATQVERIPIGLEEASLLLDRYAE